MFTNVIFYVQGEKGGKLESTPVFLPHESFKNLKINFKKLSVKRQQPLSCHWLVSLAHHHAWGSVTMLESLQFR